MGHADIPIVRRWFREVWDEGRAETIQELLHRGALAHAATGDCVGPGEWRARFWDPMRAAFSDIAVTIDDIQADGSRVAVRWRATLRHTGAFLGVPATGKTLEPSGMSWLRLENGQIVEGWDAWDFTGLLIDLGAPLDVLKQSRPA